MLRSGTPHCSKPRHRNSNLCWIRLASRILRRSGLKASQPALYHYYVLLETNNIMTIRPLYDRIVVRRMKEQESMSGSIVIPDSAKEKPQEADVIAVGPGKLLDDGKLSPLDVKAGDRILLGKYSGSEIKLDGEEFLIVREDEVLGVLTGLAKSTQKAA